MLTDNYDSYFHTAYGKTRATIVLSWNEAESIGNVVLKENIRLSQRIERFNVYAELGGKRTLVYEGSVVGYKRIIPLNLRADRLIIDILDSRVFAALSFIGVYTAAK